MGGGHRGLPPGGDAGRPPGAAGRRRHARSAEHPSAVRGLPPGQDDPGGGQASETRKAEPEAGRVRLMRTGGAEPAIIAGATAAASSAVRGAAYRPGTSMAGASSTSRTCRTATAPATKPLSLTLYSKLYMLYYTIHYCR